MKTMKLEKSSEVITTYEVWFGPKEVSEREIKVFVGRNSKEAREAEQKAMEFFRKKEKEGMNVDVVLDVREMKTMRSRLTS